MGLVAGTGIVWATQRPRRLRTMNRRLAERTLSLSTTESAQSTQRPAKSDQPEKSASSVTARLLAAARSMYILRSNDRRPELTLALAGTWIPSSRPLPSPEFSKPPSLVSSCHPARIFLPRAVLCFTRRSNCFYSTVDTCTKYASRLIRRSCILRVPPPPRCADTWFFRSLSGHSSMDSSRCRYL